MSMHKSELLDVSSQRLDAKHLSKSYGGRKVVKDVSLTVKEALSWVY